MVTCPVGADCQGEDHRKVTAAGAGLDDVALRGDVHFHQDVAGVFGIDDLAGAFEVAHQFVGGRTEQGKGVV